MDVMLREVEAVPAERATSRLRLSLVLTAEPKTNQSVAAA
jgi:hypothetical protein